MTFTTEKKLQDPLQSKHWNPFVSLGQYFSWNLTTLLSQSVLFAMSVRVLFFGLLPIKKFGEYQIYFYFTQRTKVQTKHKKMAKQKGLLHNWIAVSGTPTLTNLWPRDRTCDLFSGRIASPESRDALFIPCKKYVCAISAWSFFNTWARI